MDDQIHSSLGSAGGCPGHKNFAPGFLTSLKLAPMVLAPSGKNSASRIMPFHNPASTWTDPGVIAIWIEGCAAEIAVPTPALAEACALRNAHVQACADSNSKLHVRKVLVRRCCISGPDTRARASCNAHSCGSLDMGGNLFSDELHSRSMGGLCQNVLRSGDANIPNAQAVIPYCIPERHGSDRQT